MYIEENEYANSGVSEKVTYCFAKESSGTDWADILKQEITDKKKRTLEKLERLLSENPSI